MSIKRNLNKILKQLLSWFGYTIFITRADSYNQDGLYSIHNHEFMNDLSFLKAYARGIQSSNGVDPSFHWRAHVALWVSHVASQLDGDFVECGVNMGFISSAIMHDLNWNSLDKVFYLLDTFDGPGERYYTDIERRQGKVEEFRKVLASGGYNRDIDSTIKNFSEWKRIRIIKGLVPESLYKVDTKKISYLHLDMNCAIPEVSAANIFWERLVAGGIILLDDYAYYGYRTQKLLMDEFAIKKDIRILSLPTGQGLIIKPPH